MQLMHYPCSVAHQAAFRLHMHDIHYGHQGLFGMCERGRACTRVRRSHGIGVIGTAILCNSIGAALLLL